MCVDSIWVHVTISFQCHGFSSLSTWVALESPGLVSHTSMFVWKAFWGRLNRNAKTPLSVGGTIPYAGSWDGIRHWEKALLVPEFPSLLPAHHEVKRSCTTCFSYSHLLPKLMGQPKWPCTESFETMSLNTSCSFKLFASGVCSQWCTQDQIHKFPC